MQASIICRFCSETVSAHWEALEHTACTPGQGPQARRLQSEAKALEQRFRQRAVSLRLHGTGLRVTRAEER
jgi:hypothetical protein